MMNNEVLNCRAMREQLDLEAAAKRIFYNKSRKVLFEAKWRNLMLRCLKGKVCCLLAFVAAFCASAGVCKVTMQPGEHWRGVCNSFGTNMPFTVETRDFSKVAIVAPTAAKDIAAILSTYFKRGGQCLHLNCFDSALLREATAHPEKYPDLQVRVCGWNIRWNDLSPQEKRHFIATAEAQE